MPSSAVVSTAEPAKAPAPPPANEADEATAETSEYPDAPEDGTGEVRDVGPRKIGAGRCLLRVGRVDPSLDAVVRGWFGAREASAAHEAARICSSTVQLGLVAAGFACRALARRSRLLVVACYTFPNVGGNANPSRSHAVFDLTGGRPKALTVGDMFVDRPAACSVVGAALAARGPQLHERSPTEWSEKCRVSRGAPVADDTVSVVGANLTFDVTDEFMAWGNAPDPLRIPIADLRAVLTARFAALLGGESFR